MLKEKRKNHKEIRTMPAFIKELQTRIEVHNKNANAYTGTVGSVENQLADAERRSKGMVTTDDLENEIQAIENDLEMKVRLWFKVTSGEVEYDQYHVKADCCPTVLHTLAQYWFED
jgi:hypothetical protein